MRKSYLTFLRAGSLLAFLLVLANFSASAQEPAAATWPLLADTEGVPATTGGIEAADQSLSNLEINQYSGLENSQRIRDLNNAWPAGQTDTLAGTYVQFSVTPAAGQTLDVSSISYDIASAGTNAMSARAFYSTDPGFQTATEIPEGSGDADNNIPRDNDLTELASVNAAVNVTVAEGETFYVRIYPWMHDVTEETGRSGKYVLLQNVVIAGETSDGDGGGGGGGSEGPTHFIANTADLKAFVEDTTAWNPGDTIMLTTPGEYITDTIRIHQSVTIMGDPSLASRPLVTFTGNGFMPTAEGIDLTFKGFDVNGLTVDDQGAENRAFLLQYGRTDTVGANRIVFEDMEAYGLNTGIELFYNQGKNYNSIIIHNVVWHDITNWVFDPRLNAVRDVRITNSTFYNTGGLMKNPYFANNDRPEVIQQKILIDHNTFYNVVGPGGSDALLQINDPSDGSVQLTFSNNIVSTLREAENTRPFRINPAAGVFVFSNNVFHDFESARDEGAHNLEAVDEAQNNIIVSNTITDDPGFANAEAGDFTIAEGSPLLTAGTHGGVIGDPSWAPAPAEGTHRITNAGANSLERFIENTSLWNPGDTIYLSSTGEYHINGSIEIYQDIVLMADPALTSRPLLTFYDNGFVPSAEGLSMTFKGFDMNGLSMRAGNEHRASILQYGRENPYGAEEIIIEDVNASGFHTGVELYYNQGQRYENIVINDVVWSDIANWVFDPRLNAVVHLEITNSTFYNTGGLLKNPYFSNNDRPEVIQQEIIIDRNTFYNVVGPAPADALIQINDPSDQSVNLTFSNNIVSTLRDPENTRPFRINAEAGQFNFNNNAFFDFESARDEGAHNLASVAEAQANITVTGGSEDDPAFRDAEANIFLLPLDSPYLTAAADGGAIGDPDWAPEVGVTIMPVSRRVATGDEVQMEAVVVQAGDGDMTVSWSVDDENVATIDASTGVLTAVGAGTVTVTATSNADASLQDQMMVTVEERIAVESIALIGRTASGSLSNVIATSDSSLYLETIILPENVDNRDITWSVDDESVATIDENGRLFALQNGTVIVTATHAESGISEQMEVNINLPGPAVESITVSAEGDQTTLAIGETLQMNAELGPEGAEGAVIWSVDDETLATISEDGLLTAVAAGVVTVTATSADDESITDSMEITIEEEVTAIDPEKAILAKVYPNPFENVININASSEVQVSIHSTSGRLVLSKTIKGAGTVSVARLEPGLYVAHIKSGNKLQTLKLIKQ